MVRFEKELQQRELRNEMKLRLSKLQTQNRPIINIIDTVGMTSRSLLPSPSPITPNSTDELLPIVDEGLEVSCYTLQFNLLPHICYIEIKFYI